MIPIAISDRVHLFSPEKKRFSFFNSPYPAHRRFCGLDIYPSDRFGHGAPSPLGGIIRKIRFVETPPSPSFQKHRGDFVILVESSENPERWVKILHIEPCVEEGQVIRKGETIGHLIRPGFFGYATPPHMHLEVRHPDDPLRAGGGIRIQRLVPAYRSEAIGQLSGKIVRSTSRYHVMAPDGENQLGIRCGVDGISACLDGGIPYYRWFGLHTEKAVSLEGRDVSLCGRHIARIESSGDNTHLAKCLDFTFRLGKVPVGCSFHLYPQSAPLIYIVPVTDQKPGCSPGDHVTVTIETGGR